MDTLSNQMVYLSLGSNLGDRAGNLDEAQRFLGTMGDVVNISPIYETEPMGMDMETGMFFNIAVSFRTTVEPLQLLKAIKAFEQRMGRDLEFSHNRPRTIDIDILMVEHPDYPEGYILNNEALIIPHIKMAEREFVLAPLDNIAPNLHHPILKKTITQLLKELTQPSCC